MPSFDIVSELDLQEVDNAVNNVRKEVETRYDFRGVITEMEFNRKIQGHFPGHGRRHEDPGHPGPAHFPFRAPQGGPQVHGVRRAREDVARTAQAGDQAARRHRQGFNARKLVKIIKDSKLKVQAAIQDEQVRVTGKQIDDLQAVMALLRGFGVRAAAAVRQHEESNRRGHARIHDMGIWGWLAWPTRWSGPRHRGGSGVLMLWKQPRQTMKLALAGILVLVALGYLVSGIIELHHGQRHGEGDGYRKEPVG